jgi:hypothetical protein
MTSTSSNAMQPNTIAVPITDVAIRGRASPWEMLRDAVAAHLAIDPQSLPIESIRLGAPDYARLMAEERLHEMLGFGPCARRAAFKKGLIKGFAYLSAVAP